MTAKAAQSNEGTRHRGAHPEDRRLFSPAARPALLAAVADLSWLLGRGYTMSSSLKIVGDRYTLQERQRLAISRAACPESSRLTRARQCLPLSSLQDQDLVIDGFNLLITIEAALGGGVIMRCRDNCLRDISSIHGTYRSVHETEQALLLIGSVLLPHAPRSVTWLLDQPISNSGRLAQRIREIGVQNGWPWHAELLFNPDNALIASQEIIVTTDSNILNQADRWINLAAALIPHEIPNTWLIDLSESAG